MFDFAPCDREEATDPGGGAVTDSDTKATTSNRLASIPMPWMSFTRTLTHDAAGRVTQDLRPDGTYAYAWNAEGRFASVTADAVLTATYVYYALGQQAIRRLHSGATVTEIHSVHDAGGNRIAEYDYDPVSETSTLLREYVWFDGKPVAIVEGGTIYSVRADHIGRPVFATNPAGVKVWSATWLPFGGVFTQTSNPPVLPQMRFPGQWFQAESGLHQNWMGDYDPTTGRYLQPDPLGMIDGPDVYGYARQSPGRYVDPRGEFLDCFPAGVCRLPGLDMGGGNRPGRATGPGGGLGGLLAALAGLALQGDTPQTVDPEDCCKDIYDRISEAVKEMIRRWKHQV